jgi:hypothetical protein
MGAKRLQPGEIFLTQTKILSYQRKRPYKTGTEKYFQKGKRRYLCKVVSLVEVTCGFHTTPFTFLKNAPITSLGPRYWRYKYLVKVIKN